MYEVSGPTLIGTTGKLNEILGDVTFTSIGTAQGTVYFADSVGYLKALPPSAAGMFLTTQGPNQDPVWSNTPSANEATFLNKSGTQVISGLLPTVITGFTSSPSIPQYNTGSFNPVSGVFTANANSGYYVEAAISYTHTSNAGSRQLIMLRNGVAIAQTTVQPTGNVSITNVISVIASPQLNMTDTITFQFQNINLPAGKVSTIQGGIGSWVSITRS